MWSNSYRRPWIDHLHVLVDMSVHIRTSGAEAAQTNQPGTKHRLLPTYAIWAVILGPCVDGGRGFQVLCLIAASAAPTSQQGDSSHQVRHDVLHNMPQQAVANSMRAQSGPCDIHMWLPRKRTRSSLAGTSVRRRCRANHLSLNRHCDISARGPGVPATGVSSGSLACPAVAA